MGGAAVGKESLRRGICVERKALDSSEAEGFKTRCNVVFKIELPMAVAPGSKETGIALVFSAEAFEEAMVHLIRSLGDTGADRRDNPVSSGTQPHHRLDGAVGDAGNRAFPARMRRPDDACLPICQQDRSAIGSDDAEDEARLVRDDGIGMGPVGFGPRVHTYCHAVR